MLLAANENLDGFVLESPSDQHALDLFKGSWSSILPTAYNYLKAGQIPLFEDRRIWWLVEAIGGVVGFNILELGPLEGGHTYMLEEHFGAASILAVEANKQAFLKCLVAKEILGAKKSHFLLGDFIRLLESGTQKWDLIHSSGVLYHMRDPARLIQLIGERTDRVFIWTHYFDEAKIKENPAARHHFGESWRHNVGGFEHTLYRQDYLETLGVKGFSGGNDSYSCWLALDDIRGALRHFGFVNIAENFNDPDHQHGPCVTIAAWK